MKNEFQKTNRTGFRIKKVIKNDKFYVKWKDHENLFNKWIDKRYCYENEVFSRTYIYNKNKINVELNLSNDATKSD